MSATRWVVIAASDTIPL